MAFSLATASLAAPSEKAMEDACAGAATDVFGSRLRQVEMTGTGPTDGGYEAYGVALLHDGSASGFVCSFDADGAFLSFGNSG